MRGGHRGAGDGVGGSVAADPGREDIGTGGKHVYNASVVAVGGNTPGRVDSTDSDRVSSRGRGCVASISGAVSGGDDGEDTRAVGRVDGAVEGR